MDSWTLLLNSFISLITVVRFYPVLAQTACPRTAVNVVDMCTASKATGFRVLIDTSLFHDSYNQCQCSFSTTTASLKVMTSKAPGYKTCGSLVTVRAGNHGLNFDCLDSGSSLNTSLHKNGEVVFRKLKPVFEKDYCVVLATDQELEYVSVTCHPPSTTTTMNEEDNNIIDPALSKTTEEQLPPDNSNLVQLGLTSRNVTPKPTCGVMPREKQEADVRMETSMHDVQSVRGAALLSTTSDETGRKIKQILPINSLDTINDSSNTGASFSSRSQHSGEDVKDIVQNVTNLSIGGEAKDTSLFSQPSTSNTTDASPSSSVNTSGDVLSFQASTLKKDATEGSTSSPAARDVDKLHMVNESTQRQLSTNSTEILTKPGSAATTQATINKAGSGGTQGEVGVGSGQTDGTHSSSALFATTKMDMPLASDGQETALDLQTTKAPASSVTDSAADKLFTLPEIISRPTESTLSINISSVSEKTAILVMGSTSKPDTSSKVFMPTSTRQEHKQTTTPKSAQTILKNTTSEVPKEEIVSTLRPHTTKTLQIDTKQDSLHKDLNQGSIMTASSVPATSNITTKDVDLHSVTAGLTFSQNKTEQQLHVVETTTANQVLPEATTKQSLAAEETKDMPTKSPVVSANELSTVLTDNVISSTEVETQKLTDVKDTTPGSANTSVNVTTEQSAVSQDTTVVSTEAPFAETSVPPKLVEDKAAASTETPIAVTTKQSVVEGTPVVQTVAPIVMTSKQSVVQDTTEATVETTKQSATAENTNIAQTESPVAVTTIQSGVVEDTTVKSTEDHSIVKPGGSTVGQDTTIASAEVPSAEPTEKSTVANDTTFIGKEVTISTTTEKLKAVEDSTAVSTQTSSSKNTSSDICKYPAVSGPCRAYFLNYYYNSSLQTCEMFVYGGCGGNENNFESLDECMAACGTPEVTTTKSEMLSTEAPLPTTVAPKAVTEETTHASTKPTKQETAAPIVTKGALKAESVAPMGTTEALKSETTASMVTTEAYKSETGAPVMTTEPRKPDTDVSTEAAITALPSDICKYPAVSGPCRAYFLHYYYNSSLETCEMFVYGGCGGNENNFESLDECMAACGKAEVTTAEAEVPLPTTTTHTADNTVVTTEAPLSETAAPVVTTQDTSQFISTKAPEKLTTQKHEGSTLPDATTVPDSTESKISSDSPIKVTDTVLADTTMATKNVPVPDVSTVVIPVDGATTSTSITGDITITDAPTSDIKLILKASTELPTIEIKLDQTIVTKIVEITTKIPNDTQPNFGVKEHIEVSSKKTITADDNVVATPKEEKVIDVPEEIVKPVPDEVVNITVEVDIPSTREEDDGNLTVHPTPQSEQSEEETQKASLDDKMIIIIVAIVVGVIVIAAFIGIIIAYTKSRTQKATISGDSNGIPHHNLMFDDEIPNGDPEKGLTNPVVEVITTEESIQPPDTKVNSLQEDGQPQS